MSTFYAQYPPSSASNASIGSNGTTAPTSSTEIGGINPSGNLQPLQTDAAGNLLVDIASPLIISSNITEFGSNPVVTGVGASGLGIPRVTVSNDSTVGLNAGSNNIGSITNITGTVSLPTGAATAALQTTGNTSLSTIATNSVTQATAANQTNVQSAPGTSTSTAMTIQGNSLAIPVPVSGTVASTTTGTPIANSPVYNAYASSNITTTAYVPLVASTANPVNTIHIFDSSGQAMILATGPSGSEVDQIYVPPGGDTFTLYIPVGTRIAYKALTADATAGYLLMDFLQ